jgi:hypothetical protein
MKHHVLRFSEFGAAAFGIISDSGQPPEIIVREDNGEFSIENVCPHSALLLDFLKLVIQRLSEGEDEELQPFDEEALENRFGYRGLADGRPSKASEDQPASNYGDRRVHLVPASILGDDEWGPAPNKRSEERSE